MLVLLAALNGARWIGEQLESILAQENVQLSVVIKDDGSTDGTLEKIRGFSVDRRIALSQSAQCTGSASQNFLALIRENSAETFDFVAFADQDDRWFPDKLARACRMLNQSDAVGYSSATIAAWPNGRTAILHQTPSTTPIDFLFEGGGQGCTFVLRRAFYERLRAFLNAHPLLTAHIHYHDWAAYAVARTWELRWYFDGQPSLTYRQHEANDTGARYSLPGIRKRLSRIRRGWYAAQLRAICELCYAAAPDNYIVRTWRATLLRSDTWSRRAAILHFCLQRGRRRFRDNVILMMAAVAGWI